MVFRAVQENENLKSVDVLLANAAEEASTGKPTLQKKKSMKMMMIKGVQNEKDELETTKYLEHWGANPEVRDKVHDFLNRAKGKDRVVSAAHHTR